MKEILIKYRKGFTETHYSIRAGMDGLLVSGFTGYSGCPDHGRDGESECCLLLPEEGTDLEN